MQIIEGGCDTLIQDGKIQHKQLAKELMTVAELGYDITPINEVIYANTGPKVPAERIAKLADALTKAFQNPEYIKLQKGFGVYPTLMTGADLRKIIQSMYSLVNEHKAELAG